MNVEDTEGVTGPPLREDYRLLIEGAWADIHHSRNQEWRAFVGIVAAHLAIFQAVNYSYQSSALSEGPWPTVAGGLVSLFAAFVGALVTLRHRRLLRVKVRWIYRAEKFLGLVREKTEAELIAEENDSESAEKDLGENHAIDWGVIPRDRGLENTLKWRGLETPRFLATSWLILALYILLGLLDLVALAIAIAIYCG